MSRWRCRNESKELQDLLETTPDLLPGEQIDPENPRRWLLVKREMPVPSPQTGADRWSLDFFFVDQDAIPTFVECKRFADTRSRREIVGQMLEYAASGYYYWTKEELVGLAEAEAKKRNLTLEDCLRSLEPYDEVEADEFFERVQQNLREGLLRIIFFLDESPMELRSVVDFLNKQMERSEVLLVEARQFSYGDMKILVPALFGYTEEARKAKMSVAIPMKEARRKWDRNAFFIDARAKLQDEDVRRLEVLYDTFLKNGCGVTFGSGNANGSFNVKVIEVCERSLLTVNSAGNLIFNFPWIHGTDRSRQARDRLRKVVVEEMGLDVADNYTQKWRTYKIAEWRDKSDALKESVGRLIEELRASPTGEGHILAGAPNACSEVPSKRVGDGAGVLR